LPPDENPVRVREPITERGKVGRPKRAKDSPKSNYNSQYDEADREFLEWCADYIMEGLPIRFLVKMGYGSVRVLVPEKVIDHYWPCCGSKGLLHACRCRPPRPPRPIYEWRPTVVFSVTARQWIKTGYARPAPNVTSDRQATENRLILRWEREGSALLKKLAAQEYREILRKLGEIQDEDPFDWLGPF
jgi:hypothetical protein